MAFNLTAALSARYPKYVTKDMDLAAFNAVVPPWIRVFVTDVINTARVKAALKKVKYFGLLGICQGSEGKIMGPADMMNIALDNSFYVPVGGFKFGDINPRTGQPFPGGIGKSGSYVILEDKPITVGEEARKVARTYSKKSGSVQRQRGFLSEALEQELGSGIKLSVIGRVRLQGLGLAYGTHMAHSIVEKVKIEAQLAGYVVVTPTVQIHNIVSP